MSNTAELLKSWVAAVHAHREMKISALRLIQIKQIIQGELLSKDMTSRDIRRLMNSALDAVAA